MRSSTALSMSVLELGRTPLTRTLPLAAREAALGRVGVDENKSRHAGDHVARGVEFDAGEIAGGIDQDGTPFGRVGRRSIQS